MKAKDIIKAYVPYEEGQGGKYRPVLIFILTGNKDEFIGLKITTKARKQNRVQLKHWKEAGLHMPSYVQCDNFTVFNSFGNVEYIGTISDEDYKKVTDKFNELNK